MFVESGVAVVCEDEEVGSEEQAIGASGEGAFGVEDLRAGRLEGVSGLVVLYLTYLFVRLERENIVLR